MASCFALWKDADPDIPIVREAKAGYEKQGRLAHAHSSSICYAPWPF